MENIQSVSPNQKSKDNRLEIRDYAAYLMVLVMNGLLLFIPAGRIDWLEGWIWMGLRTLYLAVTTLWAARNDPALLKERSLSGQSKGVRWDKVVANINVLLFFSIFVIAGLDAVRFGWSHISWTVKGIAIFVLLVGFGITIWAMTANPFLSAIVRIQTDRGHHVVMSGPYQYVRHPMYVGVLLLQISAPFILGSLWALIPAGLDVLLFIIRTALEDKTLQAELQGYREYTQMVKYRLIPGIW